MRRTMRWLSPPKVLCFAGLCNDESSPVAADTQLDPRATSIGNSASAALQRAPRPQVEKLLRRFPPRPPHLVPSGEALALHSAGVVAGERGSDDCCIDGAFVTEQTAVDALHACLADGHVRCADPIERPRCALLRGRCALIEAHLQRLGDASPHAASTSSTPTAAPTTALTFQALVHRLTGPPALPRVSLGPPRHYFQLCHVADFGADRGGCPLEDAEGAQPQPWVWAGADACGAASWVPLHAYFTDPHTRADAERAFAAAASDVGPPLWVPADALPPDVLVHGAPAVLPTAGEPAYTPRQLLWCFAGLRKSPYFPQWLRVPDIADHVPFSVMTRERLEIAAAVSGGRFVPRQDRVAVAAGPSDMLVVAGLQTGGGGWVPMDALKQARLAPTDKAPVVDWFVNEQFVAIDLNSGRTPAPVRAAVLRAFPLPSEATAIDAAPVVCVLTPTGRWRTTPLSVAADCVELSFGCLSPAALVAGATDTTRLLLAAVECVRPLEQQEGGPYSCRPACASGFGSVMREGPSCDDSARPEALPVDDPCGFYVVAVSTPVRAVSLAHVRPLQRPTEMMK